MEIKEDLLAFIADQALEKCDYRALGVLLNGFAYAECYQMLCEIHDVICDSTIPDSACFFRIERIMASFRKRGIGTGDRHAHPENEYGEIPLSRLVGPKE